MRTKLIAVAALAIATGAALATPAHATTTVGGCQVLIEDLSADTAAATSLGRAGAGLVAKADAAAVKLDESKTADALEKLLDYDSTLDALFSAPKPKVSETDYAALNTDVEAAIACIGESSAS
jgi:hypothetical protein